MSTRIRSILPFLAAAAIPFLLLTAAPLFAQSTGRVQGTIVDRDGKGIEKADISLTSEKFRTRIQKGKSKKDGKFVFPFAETGPHIIEVNVPGYKVVRVAVESREQDSTDTFKKEYFLSPKDAIPTLEIPFTGTYGHCKVDITIVKEEEFADAYRALKGAGQGGQTAAAADPAAGAAPAPPSGGAGDPYDAGRQLADAGKHAEAVPLFQQALAASPDEQTYLIALGRSQLEAGDAAGAETTLQKLVSLNPSYASAHYYLGKAQAANFKNAAAIASFRKEIEISPDKAASLLLHVASAQMEMAKTQPAALEQARATLEEVLVAEPNNTNALSQLADFYRQKGDRAKQEEMYQKLVAADPQNADVTFFNLGALAVNGNRREEAAANFLKAIEVNPKHAEAHLQLAYCLVGLGKIPDAVTHFEQYLSLEPTGKRGDEVRKLVAKLKG